VRELIIFPGALGDLICAYPAFCELIRRADGALVELMARAELARFAVGRMGFVRGHSIDRAEVSALFVNGAPHQRPAQFFGVFSRVHSFFANEPTFKMNLGALVPEVAFYRFRPDGDGHISTAYLREIGVEATFPAPLRLLPQDRARAERVLADVGLEPGKFLLILPGSGSLQKNWPAANFMKLAKSLQNVLPSLIVLGPAEVGLEGLVRGSNLKAASDLDLGTVAGLASMARGFLGNDSGVSHLAAASGAPGLVIFGPTDPARWRPRGPVEVLRREPLAELTVDEVCGLMVRLIRTTRAGDTVRRPQ